jgi:hypothetical protein
LRRTFISKKFLIGVITLLLSVSLFFIGCDTGGGEKIVDHYNVIHIDVFADDATELQGILYGNVGKTVAYKESEANVLEAKLTVPPKTTLVVYSTLAAIAAGIEVQGTVYVGVDGDLQAEDDKLISVTGDGVINVLLEGTLTTDVAEVLLAEAAGAMRHLSTPAR